MEWAERKGWNQGLDTRSFGDWCALLHTEISEAYEDHRNHRGYNEIYFERGDMPGNTYTVAEAVAVHDEQIEQGAELTIFKPCGIPIEIADLAIRLFHLAEFFEFDLTQMIADKMAYNEKRPYRHGGKRI